MKKYKPKEIEIRTRHYPLIGFERSVLEGYDMLDVSQYVVRFFIPVWLFRILKYIYHENKNNQNNRRQIQPQTRNEEKKPIL